MCTEFLLACLYFLILSLINFFLLKLLGSYLKNIFKLRKIKNISRIYPTNKLFRKLYTYSNKEYQNLKTLNTFNTNQTKSLDPLILGNIYKYFANNNLQTSARESTEFYFQLLANQYLPVEIVLK
jgi:type I restriction-modification system DNA methylase subunit